MNGHIVHALLGLLLDHFEHHFRRQVGHAADAHQCLVNRDGPDRNRGSVQDRLADARDVAAGRKVHDRIGAVMDCDVELVEFFLDLGGDGRVADVGVDLAG